MNRTTVNQLYVKEEDSLADIHDIRIPENVDNVIGSLNTNNTAAQTVNSNEALNGSVSLHKVSKTGNYADLIDKIEEPLNTRTANSQLDLSKKYFINYKRINASSQGTPFNLNDKSIYTEPGTGVIFSSSYISNGPVELGSFQNYAVVVTERVGIYRYNTINHLLFRQTFYAECACYVRYLSRNYDTISPIEKSDYYAFIGGYYTTLDYIGNVDANGWINEWKRYPDFASNSGKVLAVNTNTDGVEWITTGDPYVTATDSQIDALYTGFSVTVTSGTGGSATASSNNVSYKGSVTLTATPDTNYRFVKWSDDNTDNPRTITNIQNNITLSASFTM